MRLELETTSTEIRRPYDCATSARLLALLNIPKHKKCSAFVATCFPPWLTSPISVLSHLSIPFSCFSMSSFSPPLQVFLLSWIFPLFKISLICLSNSFHDMLCSRFSKWVMIGYGRAFSIHSIRCHSLSL